MSDIEKQVLAKFDENLRNLQISTQMVGDLLAELSTTNGGNAEKLAEIFRKVDGSDFG